jgi:hypothetical protein
MKTKIVILVAVLLVVVLIGMRVYEEFFRAYVGATHSAAAQLHQDLSESRQTKELTDDWNILSDDQYSQLLASLTEAGASFDAPSSWKLPNGQLVDAWGNRFQIKARLKANGTGAEFVVWSLGPDGKSGTVDDIVVP